MTDTILSLAKQFIVIKSTPDNTEALEEILDLALAQLQEFTIERFEKAGVRSALIYNAESRPRKFKVLFNVHLDIIPAKEEQHIPRVKGDKLYGAGAMDMKANAACTIFAFKEVAKIVDYPMALQLVTDEEVGGFNGAKHQVDQGVRAEFVIATEPTNLDIVHKTKGVLWLTIFGRGKTAHGAYPWRGENAIGKINDFLSALKKRYPNPTSEKWVTTVNVSKIETGNQAFNKIPDDCTVSLDIRFVPSDGPHLVKNIRALLPKGCRVEVLANEPAINTSPGEAYIKLMRQASKKVTGVESALRGAQGSSDARHFTRVGSAGVEIGPVGGGIGSDKEWVSIRSLGTFHRILKEFLLAVSS